MRTCEIEDEVIGVACDLVVNVMPDVEEVEVVLVVLRMAVAFITTSPDADAAVVVAAAVVVVVVVLVGVGADDEEEVVVVDDDATVEVVNVKRVPTSDNDFSASEARCCSSVKGVVCGNGDASEEMSDMGLSKCTEREGVAAKLAT